MNNTKSKNGLYSILIGLLGWSYLIWLINVINVDQARIFNKYGHLLVQFPEITEYSSFKYRLIAIVIGIIGIYFGIKALLRKKEIGILGILISLGVILMSFYPLGNLFLF